MAIASINPATGEVLQTFTTLTPPDIEVRITRSELAFRAYRHTSLAERAAWLNAAAEILLTEKERFAHTMTLEMGKPIGGALAEVEKCALVCRYYAKEGAGFLQPEKILSDASNSYVMYQPLGIILAVMPWNFPFWQVFRFAAPALMAGNVALLKHASNVPQSALLIEEIIRQAGFPPDVFQTLLMGSDRVSLVLQDSRVKAATLTGSEAAGKSFAALAGQELKKTVLELGGSDPFIVLPSADIEKAVDTAVTARMLNSGQSCIAAKRFIVHRELAPQFTEQLKQRFEALILGNPMDMATEIGPLATPGILEDLVRQVDTSIRSGARVITGGQRLANSPGNYYLPTLLTDIPIDCPAYKEELFGPVAALFTVSSLDEAIRLANDTPLGLGASAWTHDREEQEKLIEALEAGAVFMNGMVKSDPRLPFGGTKRSGYGRELGKPGMLEFVNIKSIWIA